VKKPVRQQEDGCHDTTPHNKTSHVKQTTRISVVMEQCLSFFSSSVMEAIKKGIMAENFFFYKSKFDNLAIGKEFGIVL
jgi:hypothetical protein